MKKLIQGILGITVAILLCIILSGCQRIEVSERAFIKTIGIDKRGANILLTLSGEEFKDGKTEIYTMSGTGKNISEALNDAEKKQSQKLFLGHCKMIVLGDSVTAISDELDFFLNSNRVSPSVQIVLSDLPAEQLLAEEFDLLGSLKRSSEQSAVSKCSLVRYYDDETSLIPVAALSGEDILFNGTQLISKGKRIASLDEKSTAGAEILMGRAEEFPLRIDFKNMGGTVIIDKIGTSCYIENKTLNIKISAKGRVTEGLYNVDIKAVQEASLQKIFSLCNEAVITSQETEVDYLNLKNKLGIKDNYEFKKFLKECSVEFSGECRLTEEKKF